MDDVVRLSKDSLVLDEAYSAVVTESAVGVCRECACQFRPEARILREGFSFSLPT